MKLTYLILVSVLALSACGGIGAKPDAAIEDMPNDGSVGRTMNRNKGKFEACARDSVSVQTGSRHKIKLNFTIDAEGKPGKARVLGMTEPDPDLQICLMRAVREIDFPKPDDKKTHTVNYPMTLKGQ